jgi:hypothetical protein
MIIIIIIITIITIIIIIIITTTRAQGASRSTAVVLAYLVRRKGMTLRDAFTLVKQRRPVARPNKGFCAQLIALETALRPPATMRLTDFGYGENPPGARTHHSSAKPWQSLGAI